MKEHIIVHNNRIEWLDSKEAAEYLRISVSNLRQRVYRGEIVPAGFLGPRRLLRFRRDDLDSLLMASKEEVSK